MAWMPRPVSAGMWRAKPFGSSVISGATELHGSRPSASQALLRARVSSVVIARACQIGMLRPSSCCRRGSSSSQLRSSARDEQGARLLDDCRDWQIGGGHGFTPKRQAVCLPHRGRWCRRCVMHLRRSGLGCGLRPGRLGSRRSGGFRGGGGSMSFWMAPMRRRGSLAKGNGFMSAFASFGRRAHGLPSFHHSEELVVEATVPESCSN